MPKIPGYQQTTRPSSQGLGYLSSAGATPEAFGAGIGAGLESLGHDVKVAELALKQRQTKTNEFEALTGLSSFQTGVNAQLTEMKRQADPTGKGFVENAGSTFDLAAQKYISSLPVELQPEYKARIAQMKTDVIGDAYSFQYTQGDAFFRKGVDDEYQKALVGLDPKNGGDPTQLAAYKQHLQEVIKTTDLPEADKVTLGNQIAMGLEGVAYKAKYAKEVVAGNVGGMAGIIRKEEGYRTKAYWDVNHWRVGYGSDTWTDANGEKHEVTKDTVVDAQGAERDLQRRITTEYDPEAQRKIGPAAWNALSGNAKAAIYSVAHNYGHIPDSVVTAARNGNTEALAAAVSGLGANPERRKREADLIRGGGNPLNSDVDNSHEFSSLTYEDRNNLQRDANSEIAKAQNDAAQAHKLDIDTRANALYNGLNDGTQGHADIDAAKQTWMTDYDMIKKAQDILDNRESDKATMANALGKIGTEGAVWDPTDDQDKKRLNMLYGKEGEAALTGMDEGYVVNRLMPIVTRAQDMPTQAAGTLMGMLRSSNPQQAAFGFDTLLQLQQQSPRAYDQRIPDDIAHDVEAWRSGRDVYSQDELLGMIRGGRDVQTRQANKVLEEEAKTLLTTANNGTTTLQDLVSGVVGSYKGSIFTGNFSAPALSGVPAYARQLSQEYQTAFTNAYKQTANKDQADAIAKRVLGRTWGVSTVGGSQVLMKHPPEQAGYKPVGGDFGWIDRNIRSELNLPADSRFELVSDDQTDQEFKLWQRGENYIPTDMSNSGQVQMRNAPVSYQIVTFDKNGKPEVAKERRFFEPSPADIQEETRQYMERKAGGELGDFAITYDREMTRAQQEGRPIDPGVEAEKNRLFKNLDDIKSAKPPVEPIDPSTQYDPMTGLPIN